MDSPLEISFALVCDDVRREDSGKLIFIGVYGDNISIQQLPGHIVLCLVVFVETKEDFNAQATFRARIDDKVVAQAPATLDYKKGKATFSFSGIPIAIEKPGNLVFELQVQGEEGVRILKTMPIISALAREAPAS